MAKPAKYCALALLASLFTVNIYRAWTQSIVHDEAYTYLVYLDAPASTLFEYYDANHHILYTLLAKICVVLFGASEFSMRLPTLAAGALYFFTIYRLSLLLFPDTLYFLLSILVLGLNPLLLDFLVAARGYGLALSLFVFALYQLLVFLNEAGKAPRSTPFDRNLYYAAVGLGLSIAANLTLLLPAAALISLFVVALLALDRSVPVDPIPPKAKKKRSKQPAVRFFRTGALRFLLPLAVLLWGFFLIVPLQMGKLENFYAGQSSPLESIRSLVTLSFAHNEGVWRWNRPSTLQSTWNDAVVFLLLPLTTLVGTWLWVEILRSRWRRASPPGFGITEAAVYLVNGTLLLGCASLVFVHYLANLPYPTDRTGLYLIPLTALVCLLSIEILKARGVAAKAYVFSFTAVLAIFVLQYLIQFNTSRFAVWWYDADTRHIMRAIEAKEKPHRPSVRLGATWQLEPSLNFYRKTWGLDWIRPVDRSGPVGDYDYYVLALGDLPLIQSRHLHELYNSHKSGTVLAER